MNIYISDIKTNIRYLFETIMWKPIIRLQQRTTQAARLSIHQSLHLNPHNTEVRLIRRYCAVRHLLVAVRADPQLFPAVPVALHLNAAAELQCDIVLRHHMDRPLVVRLPRIPAADGDRIDQADEQVAIGVHRLGGGLSSPISNFLYMQCN